MHNNKYILLLICLFCLIDLYGNEIDYIKGNAIIQLTDNDKMNVVLKNFEKNYGVVIRPTALAENANIWLLHFNEGLMNTQEIVKALKSAKYVNTVQVNHSNIRNRGEIPNDPFFPNQWAHVNSGSGGVADADMDSDEAWQITTGGYTQNGDRIVVAIIDEGIDLSHTDLTLWVNQHEIPNNNIDDDKNGYIDDVHGYDFWDNDGDPNVAGTWENHATHVAGIIGANGNNCAGVVGVNWDVDIMAIRGSATVESEVILAYNYVWEMRKKYNNTNGDAGAYVVATNSSFGIDRANPTNFPLWCAFYDSLGTAGIISAVAGPNLNINIDNEGDVPGACPSDYTICVTNTDKSDDRAYAGYGIINVDIGAPGSTIYSTVPGNNFSNMTGTSMATPQVAGAVALMQSTVCKESLNAFKPSELALFLKNKMLLEGIDSVAALSGEVSSYGRLNLFKCVTSVSANLSVNIINPSCNTNDGAITTQVIGTNFPYSYSWSNGSNASGITELNSGSYSVSFTDGNGCSTVKSVNITDKPLVTSAITDARCKGINNGSISLTVTGSETPYFYLWSNSNTSNSITGIASGTYTVTVTSSAGCKTIQNFALSDSVNVVNINTVIQNDTCGATVGKIIVSVPTKTNYYYGECDVLTASVSLSSPYTYNWSNGQTTDTILNLTNGNYFLTITSNDGCILDTNYIIYSIISSDSIDVYDSISNVSCYGDNDSWIRLDSVIGNYSPFTYNWSNNQTGNISTGLSSGIHKLVVENSVGCTFFKSYTVSEPNKLLLSLVATQMSGAGANDGSITATSAGGTIPYSYAWSTTETTNNIVNLSDGSYTITVSDINGCSISNSRVIDFISGVNEFTNDYAVQIFPNPTHGVLNIFSNQKINQIIIYNLLGEKIIDQKYNNNIDLSNQPDGLYLIEINNQAGSISRIKIIKE